MFNTTLLYTTDGNLSEPPLHKVYFFHDVRVICHTNHPAFLSILDTMLGRFPELETVRGEVTYTILSCKSSDDFPMALPRHRVRTETVRLLTNTILKYYRSSDSSREYQKYEAQLPFHDTALSVIDTEQGMALTQLTAIERYQETFLRRYVFLLSLGQLMQKYGFEPCHAATITAPDDREQGALILGDSGSGKTTLSLGCAIEGCGLLGDDLIMLREHPIEKTIYASAILDEVSVRADSLDLWPELSHLRNLPVDWRNKRYCSIEDIRYGATHNETAIRFLLFPSLTAAAHSTIIPMSKTGTFQALVEQCIGKRNISPEAQAQVFWFFSTLAEQAQGYRLEIARGTNTGPALVRSLFTGDTP